MMRKYSGLTCLCRVHFQFTIVSLIFFLLVYIRHLSFTGSGVRLVG
jgi:hypothetical protein